jgi:exodeoxyribonuclease V alpha subunit
MNNHRGVVTYLSSEISGVGQVSAAKIFEALGPTCIKDIINDKNILDSIDITEKQKTIIYEGLVANAHNEQQLIGLLNLGITMKVAIRIIRALPLNAYELVKSNPYQLIDSVEGIGFLKADAIALANGIPMDSPMRLKAALLYVLKTYVYSNGHTYINKTMV